MTPIEPVVLASAGTVEAIRAAAADVGVEVRAGTQAEAMRHPGPVILEPDGPEGWLLARSRAGRRLATCLAVGERELDAAEGLQRTEVIPLPMPVAGWRLWLAALLTRMGRLMEESSHALEVLDADGRCIYLNPAAARLLGRPRRALVGRHVEEVDAAGLQRIEEAVRLVLSERRPWGEERVAEDGRAWRLAIRPLDQESELAVLERTVTASRAPRERGPEDTRFRTLARLLDEPVILSDFTTARILSANEAAERQFGWSQEEFRARKGRDLHPRRTRSTLRSISRRLREEGRAEAPRVPFLKADGHEFLGDLRAIRFREGGRDLMLSHVRDVTAEAAREQGRLAEARLAAAARVAAGIAHDLRNPASYAQVNLGLIREALERGVGPLAPETRRKVLEMLSDATEGIDRIRRRLGDLTRMTVEEPGGFQEVDLSALVRGEVEALGMAGPAGVLEVEDGLHVRGCAEQLRQVIRSLLAQAIEVARRMGAGRFRVTARHEGDRVRVRVEARVGGEPAGERAGYRQVTGTRDPGLATWIAQQVLLAHGGGLRALSARGRFEFWLPVGGSWSSSTRSGQVVHHRRLRVLVVDDEARVRRAFERALLTVADVVAVGSGREALTILLRDEGFDVIVCDVTMEDMDGTALHAALAVHRRDLLPRILFCTGGALDEHARRYLDRLDNRVLIKPVSPTELRRAVLEVDAAARGEQPGDRDSTDSTGRGL